MNSIISLVNIRYKEPYDVWMQVILQNNEHRV